MQRQINGKQLLDGCGVSVWGEDKAPETNTGVRCTNNGVNVLNATNFIHLQMVKMANFCNMHFTVIHILL